MAVEAVASAVSKKVTNILIQDAIFFYKVIDQVEDIRVQLRKLGGFLNEAEELKTREKSIGEWVKKYLKTVYDVEDIVESYVLSLAHKKRGMSFLKNYGFLFHDLIACQNLREKMKIVEKTIQELNKKSQEELEKANGSLSRVSRTQTLSPRCTYPGSRQMESQQVELNLGGSKGEEDSDFIGYQEYLDKLVNELLNVDNDRILIPVVGHLGSGKTTLVRKVYEHKLIRAQFKCQVWLDVSEDRKAKDLLQKICNQVTKKHQDRQQLTILDDGHPEKKLSELLSQANYLITLDDVRNHTDIDRAMDQVMKRLPKGKIGSKVVIITREETFPDDRLDKGWSQPICLKGLGNGESWKLFLSKLREKLGNDECWKLFLNKLEEKADDDPLRQKILNKCQGLPLNIILLGNFLSTKNEWDQLFKQSTWDSSDIRSLSYNDLPPHYKLCLIYLGLFPKEFGIPVRRILRLWVAEGFLIHSNGVNEDFAQDCVDYLVERNLIKVTKLRSDGGPKVCLLPGYLREHLSNMAQEISLFHIHHDHHESDQPPKGARRIVEYTDIKDYAPGSNSESDHVKNLRSYLSFNFPRHDAPAKQVGNFLSKMIGKKRFGLLRVLDLEGVYKPTLPNTLKNLLQLRYLGLRWTFLDILPEAVGDLPYLETLDLKGTCINNLPSSIWKLQHLRHLNLPEVWLNLHILHPSSKLLTLWGLNIDDRCNLKTLLELRELGIICHNLENFKALMNWIASLTHLQSLSLKSVDDKHRPHDICLQSLSDLINLYYLKLLGKLNRLLEISEFPPKLRVLTLSLSSLTQDPMQTLSQLPWLAVLRLLAKSYTGQKMECPQKGFHKLTSLKLWMHADLEEWIVHKEGMPCIKELNIRHCHKLKNIPLELLKRSTLKELVLDDMLPEFVDFAKKNKSNSTILTDNSYEFSPLPWEKDAELWD